VGEGVENIGRREGVGQGGGSITTSKKGVAIEAWWQRGAHSKQATLKGAQIEQIMMWRQFNQHYDGFRQKYCTLSARCRFLAEHFYTNKKAGLHRNMNLLNFPPFLFAAKVY